MTEGFGLYPTIVNPPYTTLTAYDLNRGTIKWQIGLGDDLRLVGTRHDRHRARRRRSRAGSSPPPRGCCSSTAADRKVHVYDSATGKQVCELPLGGPTSGAPSMYELGGRQYLLVTAMPTLPQATASNGNPSVPAGPTGIVAYALPRN